MTTTEERLKKLEDDMKVLQGYMEKIIECQRQILGHVIALSAERGIVPEPQYFQ